MPRSTPSSSKPLAVPLAATAIDTETLSPHNSALSTSTSPIASSAVTRRKRGEISTSTGKAVDDTWSEAQAVEGEEVVKGVPRGLTRGPPDAGSQRAAAATTDMSWTTRNQWIVLALASGACAAFNGVFAKLTTNDLTTHISEAISRVLGLKGFDRILEIIVRCIFFGLNLAFNGVMWTLFTQALAKGTSTTRVSIMNTSTNFVITALLGLIIFAESLPPLWWLGAALLVAGNVIIGRKDEGVDDSESARLELGECEGARDGGESVARAQVGALLPEEKSDEEDGEEQDEDVPLLGDLNEPRHT
ncbi:hypothetical protein GGS20DRAFT_532351 [Poronia punctata]|nr:hypothetical protein GGS20DRAFT_532351 [Poronia punctata]